jgi:hypothetical protein
VEGGRASVNDFLNEFRNSTTISPVLGELGNLLLGWDLSSQKEPEKTLRKGFGSTRSFRKSFLDLWDSLATETDTLL